MRHSMDRRTATSVRTRPAGRCIRRFSFVVSLVRSSSQSLTSCDRPEPRNSPRRRISSCYWRMRTPLSTMVQSRVAVQSVNVHLLTLHGVIRRGVAAQNAEFCRSRALRHRDRGDVEWLEPPPLGSALSVRHHVRSRLMSHRSSTRGRPYTATDCEPRMTALCSPMSSVLQRSSCLG